MKILVIDDNTCSLKIKKTILEKAAGKAMIHAFSEKTKLLEYASCNRADAVFIELSAQQRHGIELARMLKKIQPDLNIIFSGCKTYMEEAFRLHASGFMPKPVTEQMIRDELADLRYPVKEKSVCSDIYIQTFGNFEIFADSVPLHFKRSKAKECLAYLTDRRGAAVTTRQLSSILWEDKEYTRSIQKQTQNAISCMMKTLRDAGAHDIIIKNYNSLSIDISKVKCDYYRALNGDLTAVKSFSGEYMSNYSWTETTNGMLFSKMKLV